MVREVREECGVDCAVGELLAVLDDHFDGTAPTGRYEDFHGVHLIFAATSPTTSSRAVEERTAPPTPSRGSPSPTCVRAGCRSSTSSARLCEAPP